VSAARRALDVTAVVLVQPGEPDPSVATNREILIERLGCPVLSFARCPDEDDALSVAAHAAGVVELV
jgi:hypothetical protein